MDKRDEFAEKRGLSTQTLDTFNVRVNGTGWEWDTKTTDGKVVTRWKSFFSTRPDGDETWAKYRWIPSKPDSAKYFYPPKRSLKDALADSWGTLYFVGGEPAAMTMFEVGAPHTTCTFGDGAVPETLLGDLKTWGVTRIIVIPDRDQSGLKWALKIRDLLKSQMEVDVEFRALPYPIEESHGKDVNDYWLESQRDKQAFREAIMALPAWILPEPEPEQLDFTRQQGNGEFLDLPAKFLDDIEEALGVHKFKASGWSKHHAICPFHGDEHPSADWNRDKAVLHCHSGCGGKTYLAKDVAEKLGIRLADYLDTTPAIPISKPIIELPAEIVVEDKKVEKQLRPALPKFAQLDPEQSAITHKGRKWLDDYLAWTRKSCPLAPEIFHEAMALWLLATVSTRRMKLIIGNEEIFPNLYVLVVAKTSLYRKSTAMNEAKKLLRLAGLECLLLPTDVTPEALFDELAGMKPVNFESLNPDDKRDWLLGRSVAAQRAFIKDECSSIFANLRKDYNAGLTELLLEGYQGDGGKLKKLLKSKGLITVKDMCLSFLGATTPVMYSKYISNEESENGFIARFAIITPEGIPEYHMVDEAIPLPTGLITSLRHLFLNVLPWHNNERPSASSLMADIVTPPAATVMVEPEAFQQLNEYRKALGYDMLVSEKIEETKMAAYTRLGTMVIKVAMLLAAVDAEEAPVRIRPEHAYAAQELCERWRESLHRLDRDVARSAESHIEKVLNYLRTAGNNGVTMRELMRDCAIKYKNVAEDTLKVLHEDGVIEKYEHKPEGAGRPSIRFRILSG